MNEPDDTDPLVRSFLAHYQFETIHPFLDGNGRVGRLLLSLMAYVECRLQHPWLYLSPFFDRHKDEYIDSLYRVSTYGDWNDGSRLVCWPLWQSRLGLSNGLTGCSRRKPSTKQPWHHDEGRRLGCIRLSRRCLEHPDNGLLRSRRSST